MANLSSKLTFLHDAFRRRADRFPWVRMVHDREDGRYRAFFLGRPLEDGNDALLAPNEDGSTEENNLYGELLDLTERAGRLVARMIRSERYNVASDDALLPVWEGLRDFWAEEVWLRFLLDTDPSCFRYSTNRSDDKPLALFGDDKVTAWIDNYPQVSVSALSVLKAAPRASPGEAALPHQTIRPTVGATPAKEPSKIAKAIGLKRAHPGMTDKAVAESVGCDPSTLSGSPDYRAAREAVAAEQAKRLNRSRRNRGNDMDAYPDGSNE